MKRCFVAWLTVLLILLTLTHVPISVTAYESIQDDGIGSENGTSENGTIETRVVSPPAIWLDNTSLSLEVGQSAILKATLDEVASNSQVIWSSSNQSVVSVTSSGFITGLGAGSATISASLDLEILGYTCTAQCNVVVSSSRFVVDGTYFIQNVGTSRYVNIEGPSTASGAAIQQWDFGVVDQDKWILSYHESGYYTIRSVYSGKYIGVENNSSISNANIKQYTSNTGSGTRWNFMLSNSGNIILSAKSTGGNGVVLSVPLSYNANGTDLIQYSYTNNTNYKDEWNLYKVDYTSTVNNYYDLGYSVRYEETMNNSSIKIGDYNRAVAEQYIRLLGLELAITDVQYYQSPIDVCKGTVSSSNIDLLCSHSSGTIHTNRTAVMSDFQVNHAGSNVITNVLWSCHKIKSIATNEKINYNRSCSSGTSIYILEISESSNREIHSKGVLMHELNHQYGARDHYHELANNNDPNSCKFKSICSDCGDNPRPDSCIMYRSRQDIAVDSIICEACQQEMIAHLKEHHEVS